MICFQTFGRIFLFIVSFIGLSVVQAQQSSNNTVRLYNLPKFEGVGKSLSVVDCIPQLDTVFKGHLASIQYIGASSCVNLYKERDCNGEVIVIRAHTPAHERLNRYHHESWNYKVSGAKSIGPCYEQCHLNNIQHPGPKNFSHLVKLYDKTHYRGATVMVDVQNCTRIPQPFSVLGVKVNNEICVELYENEDCSGRSVHVRDTTPSGLAFDLWSWGFGNTAFSISLCGFNCLNDNITDPIASTTTALPVSAFIMDNTTSVESNVIVTTFIGLTTTALPVSAVITGVSATLPVSGVITDYTASTESNTFVATSTVENTTSIPVFKNPFEPKIRTFPMNGTTFTESSVNIFIKPESKPHNSENNSGGLGVTYLIICVVLFIIVGAVIGIIIFKRRMQRLSNDFEIVKFHNETNE